MAAVSFDLLVTNFFIALVRGHRALHPVSDAVRKLGYVIFRIEASFAIMSGSVNPDGLACSEQRGHSVIAEWTEATKPDNRKVEQIRRYLKITPSDLVQKAGVPPKSAEKCSLWLIVLPRAVPGFSKELADTHNEHAMLCSFRAGPGNSGALKYEKGLMRDAELSRLLSKAIEARRIPLGYVRVSLSDLGERHLAKPVLQEMVSLVVKGADAFTAEELGEGVYGIWRQLDVGKRTAIVRAIDKMLKTLTKAEYAENWVERVGKARPRWRVNITGFRDRLAFANHLKQIADRFAAEVRGSARQLDLFES
jgi:hypothetical protein